MKRILITGTKSYIGNNVKKWLNKYSDNYLVETNSVRNDLWKQINFSSYDVVFHVAGIAHVSTSSDMEDIYYKINRDLTIEIAKKAKNEGVKQFIFMSSIIVYGDSNSGNTLIGKRSIPKPGNFYGMSKLQAEEGLKHLENENFKIVILRAPMIYGKGSKGNYPKLSRLVRKLPFFPDFDNLRSILYIDNLCEFVRLMIDNDEAGVFFPQNKNYIKTSEMVKLIAKFHGNDIKLVKWFNSLLKFLSGKIKIINKVFGTLAYEKSMSEYKMDYQIIDLRESIELTEKQFLK